MITGIPNYSARPIQSLRCSCGVRYVILSEYVGSGEVAEIIDLTTRLEQNHRQASRAAFQAQQMTMNQINSMVDSYSAMVNRVVEAHLLALGYHKHNRQWRRRRG